MVGESPSEGGGVSVLEPGNLAPGARFCPECVDSHPTRSWVCSPPSVKARALLTAWRVSAFQTPGPPSRGGRTLQEPLDCCIAASGPGFHQTGSRDPHFPLLYPRRPGASSQACHLCYSGRCRLPRLVIVSHYFH